MPLSNANNNSTQQRISIFPNPSNNIVNIESLVGLGSITLYDINGKQIHVENNINELSINIYSLSRSVYLLKLKTRYNEVFIKRILKN